MEIATPALLSQVGNSNSNFLKVQTVREVTSEIRVSTVSEEHERTLMG